MVVRKTGNCLKRFKIKYKRLKRVWGYADMDNRIIEIDNRVRGKKHLEICVHEAMHLLFPELSEEEVVRTSIYITNTLWYEKYRRVDDNNHLPLQDGTK